MRNLFRRALCVLQHGHHDMWWPKSGETSQFIAASCRHCGHAAVLDMSEIRPPVPKYAGIPERHTLASRRRLRIVRDVRRVQ